MYKSIILPLAKEDIKYAAHWYNEKQQGLGKRFTQEVRSKVSYIKEHPKSNAMRYNNTYCAVLNVFPFMIHYSINENQKTVIIAAVFHTSLNPDLWRKR